MQIDSLAYAPDLNIYVVGGYAKQGTYGNDKNICYSSDLVNWTVSLTTSKDLIRVVYAGGKFFCIFSSYPGFRSSSNGINWSAEVTIAPNIETIGYISSNGTYLAAISNGDIYSSLDTNQWAKIRTAPSYKPLKKFIFGNNGVIVVINKNSSGILVSLDNGATWAENTLSSKSFYDGVWANSKFVLCGYNGDIAVSSNGIDWTYPTSGTTNHLNCIAFDGARFLSIGYGTNGFAVTSTDGLNWSTQICPDLTKYSVTEIFFANGKFIATGYGFIYSSTDGTNFVTETAAPQFNAISYSQSRNCYIAVSDNGLVKSQDLKKWNRVPTVFPDGLRTAITQDGNTLIAGGFANNSGILRTTDPALSTWTLEPKVNNSVSFYNSMAGTGKVTSIVRTINQDYFISTHNQGLVKSADNGVSWSLSLFAGAQFNSSAYSPELGITVFVNNWNGSVLTVDGNGGWSSSYLGSASYIVSVFWTGTVFAVFYAGTVFTSPNGITWTSRTFASGLFPPSGYRCAAKNGSYILVAGDSGKLNSSSDHFSTAVTTFGNMGSANSANSRINGLIWHPTLSMFIAVGAGGLIATSPTGAINGTSWTSRTSGTTQDLTAIAFSPNIIVAVCGGGSTVLTSTDGVAWTSRVSPLFQANSVVWNGSLFLATGVQGSNQVITSSDGITWTSRTTQSTQGMRSAVWSGGCFYICGSTSDSGGGIVQKSSDGINWKLEISGGFNDMQYSPETNTLVAAGNTIMISKNNGVSWKSATFSNPNSSAPVMLGVMTLGGSFWVVGQSNVIVSSTDGGNTWSTTRSPLSNSSNLLDIAAGEFEGKRSFVIIGGGSGSSLANICFSADGINWRLISQQISASTSVIWNENKFVAIGNNNSVWTSIL